MRDQLYVLLYSDGELFEVFEGVSYSENHLRVHAEKKANNHSSNPEFFVIKGWNRRGKTLDSWGRYNEWYTIKPITPIGEELDA